MFALSDADVAVRWLNAAKAAKARASYNRVASIREQLEEFGILRVKIQEPYVTARRSLKIGQTTRIPGLSKHSRLHRKAQRIKTALNKALSRYVFRPHVSYNPSYDVWRGGVFPDESSRWFRAKIVPGTIVSEAVAAMSLVNLDAVGDIGKVRLCIMCDARWFVGAKRNFRFCGAD